MTFWTFDHIRSVLGGSWTHRPDPAARAGLPDIEGVSTDSRSTRPGQVFIALRGESTDGHTFADRAIAAGTALLVIDRPEALPPGLTIPPSCGVLRVTDTRAALLKLAAAYRKTLDRTRVIAVGGSNGKTTTVRLLESVLSRTLRGTASQKSFNNDIGVPLTVLAAKRADQFLICEVGTNAPGEILPLTTAIAPDIVVLTSIGREHLEGLGSLHGVIQEEASLAGGLRAGGVAITTADAPGLLDALRPHLAAQSASLLTFGLHPGADLRLTAVRTDPSGVEFTLNDRQQLRVGLLGEHNAMNAAAVVAVARRLGLSAEEIAAGLAAARGAPMRLEPRTVGGVWFLNDAYNANPESVLASLRAFDEASRGRSGRRVVILGDMLEQGENAPAQHAEVGLAAAGTRPDLLILVGSHMEHAARAAAPLAADRILRVPTVQGPGADRAAAAIRPGDAVLLKGSRGMALETIITAYERLSTQPHIEPAPASTAPQGT